MDEFINIQLSIQVIHEAGEVAKVLQEGSGVTVQKGSTFYPGRFRSVGQAKDGVMPAVVTIIPMSSWPNFQNGEIVNLYDGPYLIGSAEVQKSPETYTGAK